MNKKTQELRDWLVLVVNNSKGEDTTSLAYKTAMMDTIAQIDRIHAKVMQTCTICRQEIHKSNGTPVYDEDMTLSGWFCYPCADRSVR